jgi:small subunit ribosomal protein S16
MGSRNKPFYRLVAADSRFATTGRFLEALGWYDPKKKDENFSVNIERVEYWLGNGAQLSATAKSLVKKAKAGQGVPYGVAQAPKTPAAPVEEPASDVEEKAVVSDTAPADTEPEKTEEAAAPADDAADTKEA